MKTTQDEFADGSFLEEKLKELGKDLLSGGAEGLKDKEDRSGNEPSSTEVSDVHA